MAPSASSFPALSRCFWLLAAYLATVFALGGGARADIQSLILLRPLAALAAGAALLTLRREHLLQHRFVVGFATIVVGWVALQLVPLPPALWEGLPGRELIARIDRAAGLGMVWRPLTIDPAGAANALAALIVPLPVLLWAIQLEAREQRALVLVVLLIGLVSALCAVVQISSNALYFYRVTNDGAGVGLFANRNHQASFLAALFPLLAVFAREPKRRRGRGEEQGRLRAAAAGAMAIVLVPLLLATGSRAGLILGVIGLVAATLIWRGAAESEIAPGKPRRSPALPIAIGLAAVVVVAILAVVFSRAEAVNRLFAEGQDEDLRLRVWGPVLKLGLDTLPFGSGAGSFVTAFKVAEPTELVRPTYLNHAHNDFLEVLVTDGVVGIALIAVVTAWASIRSWRAWFGSAAVKQEAALGRMASVVLALLWLASVTDYPLRVPSLAALAVLAAVWLSEPLRLKTTKAVDV